MGGSVPEVRRTAIAPETPPPRLIVLAGLPGSGKSTVAQALARRTQAVWLRVDTLEAAMLEAGLPHSFETGVAAYLGVRDQARDHLRLGRWVIIDAVNGVREARELWEGLCAELSVEKRVVELVCPDPAEHRKRVERRLPATPPLPKPTWDEVRGREYLPWNEPHLVVDTTRALEKNVAQILQYLESDLGRTRLG